MRTVDLFMNTKQIVYLLEIIRKYELKEMLSNRLVGFILNIKKFRKKKQLVRDLEQHEHHKNRMCFV